MNSQQLSQYQEDLKLYRELRADLAVRAPRAARTAHSVTRAVRAQLWSDAFAEENGRRPDRKDVKDTGILWLVRLPLLDACFHTLTCARFTDRQVHDVYVAEAEAAHTHARASHQLGHAGSRGDSAPARARRDAAVYCKLATT